MTHRARRRAAGALGLVAGTVIASGLGAFCAQTGCGAAPPTIEAALPSAHARTVDGQKHSGDASTEAGDVAAAGTLSIEGSAVSCTVARLEEDMPDSFYLTHTLDGSWSSLGCPFLDRRSTADGAHLLLYGHHFTGSTVMFGSLWECYTQERFDELGAARWAPADGGEPATFTPFCALRVPAAYGTIQRFSFPGADDLKHWLHELAEEAGALSPTWEEQAASATRVLTAVTCTEGNGASAHRTIVVFTAS